ncbi:MAG: sigma-70 family RNA polymerase sigma factor [Planctomycetes bacterium]|nr:sigma-70 family RNA polymerase sigma factor [Planctomycetota bacterium]
MNTDDLIRLHADLVYATCLRVTGNAQDAADVSQEVFIAWMQQRQAIRGPLAAWLHATARRRALDWLRRQHRRRQHEREAPAPAPAATPDDGWREHLDASLERLDARSRTLVIEHHLFGLTQEALAERWRVSQATVSRLLARGMEHLRRELSARGVTAAGALLPPGLLPSCPTDLHAPLLAQARIGGGAGLAGGGSLGLAVPGALMTAIASLLALGAGALLSWGAYHVWRQDPDPVGTVLATLPPCARPAAVAAPVQGPRFRALEALVSRLPPMDRERQGRMRAWLTRDGSEPAWKRLQITLDSRPRLGQASFWRSHRPADWTDADERECRRLGEELAPLLAELDGDRACLGGAGWLAEDYRQGLIRGVADVHALDIGQLGVRLAANLLARAALAGEAGALDHLDRLLAAQRRAACQEVAVVASFGLAPMRDELHVRLLQAGRLPDARLEAWCREPFPGDGMLELALIGEACIHLMLAEETLAAGGGNGPAAAEIPLAGARHALAFLPHLDGSRPGPDLITGRPAAGYAHERTLQSLTDARLSHAGYRLAALLLRRLLRGDELPERLDVLVGHLADGKGLAGGDVRAWGLAYRRLSPRQFTLAIDLAGRTPDHALPGHADELGRRLEQRRQRAGQGGSLALDRLLWSVDLDRTATGEAEDEVGEPAAPGGAQ